MNSRPDIITCILFGLFLAAPLTLTVADIELTKPLEENRLRESFPRLAECEISRVDVCFKKVDNWFNDNYRPRDLLTKLKTQIDYSVFSTSDKLHIGADHWLYYRNTMDVQKVAAERLPQATFDGLLADLDTLEHYLRQRDIQLIVLPIPLKDVIYPEYLPSSVPNLPANNRYQQLRHWLAGHPSIISIDAYDLLNGRKQQAHAFHKTDFHWNDPAGFLYAEKLVNTLWQIQTGEATPLWDQQLTVEERSNSGGQANFLPLLSTPTEQALFLDVTWESPGGQYDFKPANEFWTYTYDGAVDQRGRLGGVVVIADSFFDALHRSGIDSYFASVYRSDVPPDRFRDMYANIPDGTRYLILEFIETSIFNIAVHGLSVPEN
jgi:hypothetical protein